MKWCATELTLAAGIVVGMSVAPGAARREGDTNEAHVAAARAAAGTEFAELFGLCEAPDPTPMPPPGPAPPAPGPPPRSEWHAEPVKVFDNLYFVGQTEYSAWAVTTSAGIILIDALWDYSVQDEVVGGLEKLGLDPRAIKYVIVSHGHADMRAARATSRAASAPT